MIIGNGVVSDSEEASVSDDPLTYDLFSSGVLDEDVQPGSCKNANISSEPSINETELLDELELLDTLELLNTLELTGNELTGNELRCLLVLLFDIFPNEPNTGNELQELELKLLV